MTKIRFKIVPQWGAMEANRGNYAVVREKILSPVNIDSCVIFRTFCKDEAWVKAYELLRKERERQEAEKNFFCSPEAQPVVVGEIP